MSDYYFDIETCSRTPEPDFPNDAIIAISYQQIDSRTGEAKDKLNILKSWESSEEEILRKFYPVFNLEEKWGFVPIGCNLSFDFTTLIYRFSKIGIKISGTKLFAKHPSIDIYPFLLMFNRGSFKGAALDRFTRKKYPGTKVIELYDKKDYHAIQDYIEDEAASFIELYKFLVKRLPNIWLEFAEEFKINLE